MTPRARRPTLLVAALCAACSAAQAQTYPSRSVRVLVPTTPGGSLDTLARLVAQRLSERFGQQVIVDNRPGAGGAIAGELAAKAPADGYTLFMSSMAALASNVSIAKKLAYHPAKDFAPVSLVATQHLVLLVNPSVPARSVRDLVAMARARPGQLTFASAGNGSGGHLSGELFRSLAAIDIVHIPYKGVAPALVDVMSGQVVMTFSSILSGVAQLRAGKVRGLAVTGARRSATLPDLPTMIEAGVPGYESSTWYGVVAPRATPPEIVTRLSQEIVAMLGQPEVRERIAAEGAEAVGNTPAEFGAFIEAEIAKWSKVIRAAGVRGD